MTLQDDLLEAKSEVARLLVQRDAQCNIIETYREIRSAKQELDNLLSVDNPFGCGHARRFIWRDPAGVTACAACRMFVAERVAALLPTTWYADAPLELRLEKLVEQWRKLHEREQQIADALTELRSEIDALSQHRDSEYDYQLDYQYQAGLSRAVKSIDATIAKLGLPEPSE